MGDASFSIPEILERDFVSITQAAKTAGVTPAAIAKACEDGRLKYVRDLSRRRLISRVSFEAWLARRQARLRVKVG